MSYQPLATKYRPARFEDLVGQDSVAKALANAIKLGREPHGVIFAGVRGIGKTTTARLYAKALNCDQGPTSTPCNTCASCLAIAKGSHEDVMEIDGASNTGVGDVRALQETVDYAPQRSKYKIYIVDEVHMLSTAAFNALLKTLEEPPAHVVFVFATTELVKVPQTIVSRCQTFYLQKLTLATIRDRLLKILAAENVAFEDQAVTIVAKEGHGSMRDALTALDQAIAIGEGRVTVEALSAIVSNLSSTPFLDLIDALVARDAKVAMQVVDSWDQDGAEFQDVVERLATLVRHAFVIRDLGKEALDVGLLGLDDEEVSRLALAAKAAELFDLNRLFRTLVKCHGELTSAAIDRFIFENYLFEWCFDPGLPQLESLLRGEIPSTPPSGAPNSVPASTASLAPQSASRPVMERLRDLKSEMKSQPTATTAAVAPIAEGASATPVVKAQATLDALPATWRELVDFWKQKKPLQARKLEEVRPLTYGADKIVLAVDAESYASRNLLNEAEQKVIVQEFRNLFNFQGRLIIQPMDESIRAGASLAEPEQKPEQQQHPSQTPASAPTVPESLLEIKGREAEDRRQQIVTDARQAPLTREVLSVLGGSIKDVKVRENGPIAES